MSSGLLLCARRFGLRLQRTRRPDPLRAFTSAVAVGKSIIPATQPRRITAFGYAPRRELRREPISQAQRQAEMEEEARRVDLDPAKCLKKGDPGTVQGIIKDVIPVGYWVTMPSGKVGYLPATDLGITGGVVLLERLMKAGQEITVRVDSIGGGGREILSMKRPECVPVINDRFGFANLSRNSTRKV